MRDKILVLVFTAVLSIPAVAWSRGHHPYHRWAYGEHAPAAQTIRVDSNVIVAFSPHGDATRVIVNAIDHARRQILVQAYGFSSRPILQALALAHRRGVEVRVILDKSNQTERYSGATYMMNNGIPVYIDGRVRIAHNKVMIFDGVAVLTGSFNFTRAAQDENAENILLVEDSPELARAYIRDWKWRLSQSHPYGRRVSRF
ncbi:MAG: phospholipase D family protein [Gammaproteobacteria bacterium]|nr:phospholipase D family protein [Gammaproteobacteria bacterium]